jgi:hypothetical protein
VRQVRPYQISGECGIDSAAKITQKIVPFDIHSIKSFQLSGGATGYCCLSNYPFGHLLQRLLLSFLNLPQHFFFFFFAILFTSILMLPYGQRLAREK